MKLERTLRERDVKVARYNFQPLPSSSYVTGDRDHGSELGWRTHRHGCEEVYPWHVSSASQALPFYSFHMASNEVRLL